MIYRLLLLLAFCSQSFLIAESLSEKASSGPIDGFSIATLNAYKAPTADWSKECKKLSDYDIKDALEAIIAEPSIAKPRTWNFASVALNELSSRVWAKKNARALAVLTNSLSIASGHCYFDPIYGIEAAGLSEDSVKKGGNKNKIIHPYPYNKTIKKLLYKWKRSGTDKSFNDYIRSYGSKKEKREIKNHAVRYLHPNEREKYKVTFINGRVKIGGRTPQDGLYMFCLGGKKPMLLAGFKKKGKFQHSSFFAGASVLCAGKLIIENGKITHLDLRSGHYKPTKAHGDNLKAFLKLPENMGSQANSLKIS